MVSKFLTASVVLRSLPHYARQAGFWKEVGDMLRKLRKSLIKGLILEVWTGFEEINKEYCSSVRLTAAGLLSLHLWTKGWKERETRACLIRLWALFREGTVLAPLQGGSHRVATPPSLS